MAFININKENFYHNLNQIALQTGSLEKVAIVLKDNAYGHGLELMAGLASEHGIAHAVVRNTYEAAKIESLFESILILGDKVLKHEKYSYALNSLEAINEAEKGAKVELKIDTGMHRNGIALESLDEALGQITKQGLTLVGVMTHYRSADVLSSEFFWQQKAFEKVKEKVRQVGFENVRFHSHNSAAILRNKHFSEDMVRVGIAAYGYNELETPFDKTRLKPVLSLHATKIATRVLRAGERVGYGGDFTAKEDMTISTYEVGYGDGWRRGDVSNPYVTPKEGNILGRVSMDFVALASEEDEVCIMNDAQEAAKQLGTISYEIITNLHPDITREVI
ncbi:MAG: alanine racemase [Sulfurovum sp.]|nr:alanine racemase [Sulfurovum sp.]